MKTIKSDKGKLLVGALLVLALSLILGLAITTSAQAITDNVTLNVTDSGSNPLDGVKLSYNDYGNHYVYLGTTSGGTVTVTLPDGLSTKFKAEVLGHSTQIKPGTVPCAVDFQTSEFVVHVMKSDDSDFEGIKAEWNDYGNHYLLMGTTGPDGTASIELFPGNYKFKASKDHTLQTGFLEVALPGDSRTIDFQTALAEGFARDCDSNDPIEGIKISFNDYGNNWLSMGMTGSYGKASIELFPGTDYKFQGYTQHTQKVETVDLPSEGVVVELNPTRICLNYGGSVKFNDYGTHWQAVPCGTYLFPGTYDFKFGDHIESLAISGCALEANVFIFKTIDSNGDPLPSIPIYRNDYGNHYVSVGTTDATGLLFTTDLPSGTWKFRASLKHTNQYFTSGPGLITFQTSEFVVHVKEYDGSDFEGIRAYYNDYGNHYLSMGYTDPSGNASIELFPGNYRFKAYKDHTQQTGYLEVATSGASGTIEFRTALFIVHVMKSDDSDFEGIKASFNDYGNHYLSMGNTGPDGTASIELFPGNYKFRAYKDHTQQTGLLEVAISGASGIIHFQTAKAEGFARDCDSDAPIEGIKISFNDYGNHWLSMGTTGADGKASIELFPGSNYKFRGYTQHTQEIKTDNLPSTGVVVEFNPTRICFTYPGSVKFNDYGNHWQTVPCGTYLFPGTYDFKFDSYVVPITISGCSMEGCLKIVFLKDSAGNLITDSGATITYQPNSSGAYIPFGDGALDTSGWEAALVPCGRHRYHLTYLDATQEKQTSDATVTYQTHLVTVELRDSGNNLIMGSDATVVWQSGASGGYVQFGSNTELQADGYTSMEVLPLSNRYRLSYLGATQEKHTSSATVTCQTHMVTVELRDSSNNLITGTDATILWQSGSSGSYIQFGSNAELQGNGYTSMEVLPLTNRYRMTYLAKTQEKQSGAQTVTYYLSDFQ